VKRLDKLMKAVQCYDGEQKRKVFQRMTTEQLYELVEENPCDDRIIEILTAVDGLWLLEESG
jgi:hypothetical protein